LEFHRPFRRSVASARPDRRCAPRPLLRPREWQL